MEIVDAAAAGEPERRTRPEPPEAPGLPLAGNAFALAGDVGKFLLQQYRALGPVFRVRAFGRRFTVIAGTEANLFVATSGADHLRSKEFWASFDAELGAARTTVSMDGPEHARSRKAQQRGYSRRAALEDTVVLIREARREAAAWPAGAAVPGADACRRITGAQLAASAASTDSAEYLDDLILFVRALLAARATRQRPGLLLRTPGFRRARRRIETLYRAVLTAHRPENRGPRPRDLIDDIVDLHLADRRYLPETDLKAAVLGPFIAGLETAGATLAFLFYELLKNPAIKAETAAEADRAFADGPPGAAELLGLDIIRRCAMETMRLHAIAPALTRTVANPFEFAGYEIPAGTALLIAATVPHHLPEFYREPERFDPGRFTADRAEHKQPGAYAPYGLGAHTCLGSGSAETAICAAVAAVLHDRRLELDPPGYRLRIDPVPTPSPDRGFRLRAHPRRPRESA